MPEGPSIVIAKEIFQPFAGMKVVAASGNAKIEFERLENKTITAFKSHGKHLLICFEGFTVRIHFLMFGTYLVNADKSTPLRLGLAFDDGEINLYTCSVKFLEGDVNSHYDWSADVMSDDWNPKKAKAKLKEMPGALVCDILLDQDIFSGVGNIIKNEVFYRTRVHPESLIGKIPSAKMREIISEARIYSFEFLEWKKNNVLKKHWLAYAKKKCKRCDLPLKKENTGKKKRRSFFCENCQKRYA